jgi:hypothetical protein
MKLDKPFDFTEPANDVWTSRSHTHQTPVMQQSTGIEPKRPGEVADEKKSASNSEHTRSPTMRS